MKTLMSSIPVFFVVCAAAIAVSGSPLVALPEQFYVTLGTTIPFTGVDPVAQTGGMYVDGVHRRFRVDTFWMETSRSIVVDLERGICFVLHNHNCKMMQIGKSTGKSKGAASLLGVPEGFTLHPDLYNVRGAAVKRYSGVERGEYLQQVDYYIRNMTFVNPRVIPEHQDDAPVTTQVPILWRIETQRSRRRELRAAPVKETNWRFFGQPLNELVPLDEPMSSAVEQIIADVPITVDFFNFVPMQPDPNVFLMPATCEQLSEELDRDVDVFSAQRLLVDLSFHSAHGQAVMGSLWERKARAASQTTSTDDEEEL
jgi:hypothetical protein